jgi:hypothetical protein
MIGWRKAVGALAATVLVTLGHIGLFCLIGLLLNWGFLVVSVAPFLQSAAAQSEGAPGVRSALPYLPLPLVLLLFGFGFPALYFVAGEKIGVQAGLRHLYHRNREYLHGLLAEAIDRHSEKTPRAGAALAFAGEGSVRLEGIADPLPLLPRLVLRRALRQSRAAEILAEVRRETEAGASLGPILANRLDEHLRESLLVSDLRGFWLLFAGNGAAIIAALFWLR